MNDQHELAEKLAEADNKPNGAELRKEGMKWIEKIREAEAREKTWLEDAAKAEKAYSADIEDTSTIGGVPDFNILHSNVETIVPAIYNSTPVPDIRERYPRKMTQQMGPDGQPMPPQGNPYKDVAEMRERLVTIQIDDSALDCEVESLAQDAFMAGRGIIRIRLDADEEETVGESYSQDEYGNEVMESVTEVVVSNERVTFEAVAWRDYREGPASRWEYVPWVAYRLTINDEEIKRFDGEMIDSQKTEEDGTLDSDSEHSVTVWEVWCKYDRKVKFIRESDGIILDIKDDPYGLKGFFPSPKPVQPLGLTGKRTPINPYKIYRKQAEELDSITKRIRAITSGLKVRGAIAGDASDIKAVAEAGDNELVPIANLAGLAQTGGMDKAIIWWPIDKAVQVLRELYVSREQIKQLIYEITGISDIVRGASSSSETATAQQIKTQWGSLRIKKMQTLIERTVRDLFVMTDELILNNFTISTMQEISGMDISQEMMEIISQGQRQYVIDVESDSTVKADLSRAKGEMSEFLNATAGYFSTMQPVVAAAPEAAGPVADIYSSFARVYNLGKQAEDALEKLGDIANKAGQGGKPDPAQEAAQAEMMAKQQGEQAKMQLEGQKLQLEVQRLQSEMQIKMQELQQSGAEKAHAAQMREAELGIKQIEMDLKRADLALKEADLQFQAQKAAAEIEIEIDQRRAAKVGE